MSSPYGLQITENCLICKLRQSGFFCELPKPTLEELERIKYASAYPEGAVLFVEGQSARGVYILCSGRVKLSTTSLSCVSCTITGTPACTPPSISARTARTLMR